MEMDADLSHNPKDISRFLKEIKNYDVVVGSRFIKGGGMPGRSFFRNFLTDIINLYLKLILRTGIKDMSGGFKCYRKEVLESINFDKFVSKKYSIGAEILYVIKKKGYSIKEIPITFIDRKKGASKCNMNVMLDYILKIPLIKLRHG